jgi:hypothetical protein
MVKVCALHIVRVHALAHVRLVAREIARQCIYVVAQLVAREIARLIVHVYVVVHAQPMALATYPFFQAPYLPDSADQHHQPSSSPYS